MLNPAPPADLDTTPALAKAIATWFPELGGRSISVTENEITKDNVPTLPLAMTALLRENAKQQTRGNGDTQINEEIILQFWFKVEKYKRADGSESPFWAYYSLDKLRNKLLGHLRDWRSPRGERVLYVRGDIDAEPWAVMVTFHLEHNFLWCIEENDPDPPEPCIPSRITIDICPASQPLPDPDCAPVDTCPDPCPTP